MSKWFGELAGPGSKTAMGVLLARFAESRKPEGERICFDPYAIHFVSQDMLKWAAQNPEEMKAMRERHDHLFPGLDNSLVARVRFFDDFVNKSIDESIQQLVILGAGYDSRAYRIEGLRNVMVFEVDHPATQAVKRQNIERIFGSLPDHVIYVSANLEKDEFGQKLLNMGYSRSKKTLFLMEGVLAYLAPSVVDEIFSFIANNSVKNSSVLFDYHSKSVTDGSSDLEAGRNMWAHVSQMGEPFKFGIEEGTVEAFLKERGFSEVQNVTSEDYRRAYFKGVNDGRELFRELYFAHAVVKIPTGGSII
jgi:methyltransferase (TIGR00027 family)